MGSINDFEGFYKTPIIIVYTLDVKGLRRPFQSLVFEGGW